MVETVEIRNCLLTLLPEKAIFWEAKKTLILSDIHLGKAGHFRKHGIPVSSHIHFHDLVTIDLLLQQFAVERVIFVGDLFHSDHNTEWGHFTDWINSYSDIRFILVLGNHDIHNKELYDSPWLEVVEELAESPFLFTHKEEHHPSLYNISGHVHPCVRLNGSAKQGLRLPCFYFSLDHGILPAFGKFTGFYPIRPNQSDQVFGITTDQVIRISNHNRLN